MKKTEQTAQTEQQLHLYNIGSVDAFEGERKANIFRLIAIIIFYFIELINFHGLSFVGITISKIEGLPPEFHDKMTLLAVSWSFLGLLTWFFLRQAFYLPLFKYFVSLIDLFFITVVLLLADGPKSPLLSAYFVIIAIASLRLHSDLVRFVTVSSALSYVFILTQAHLYRPVLVPNVGSSFIFMAAIVLSGLIQFHALKMSEKARKEAYLKTGLYKGENGIN